MSTINMIANNGQYHFFQKLLVCIKIEDDPIDQLHPSSYCTVQSDMIELHPGSLPRLVVYTCKREEDSECYTVAYLGFHFGGGFKIFLEKWGYLHGASRHAARGEVTCLLGGFGGMLPREIFLKWCNLVRFGEYFAQIL